MKPGRMFVLVILSLFLAGCGGAREQVGPITNEPQAGDFTVVVLPDTEWYVVDEDWYTYLRAQVDWIIATAEELNTKMVLHVGDVVHNSQEEREWQKASQTLSGLDKAGIPLLIAMGESDYEGEPPAERRAEHFNRFFGVDRYQGKPWFRGTFEPERAENAYAEIAVDGRSYLFIGLEYQPRLAAADWAGKILAENKDKTAILLTHEFLTTTNQRPDAPLAGDALNAKQLWLKTVRPYKNVALVLCGHNCATIKGNDLNTWKAVGAGRRSDKGQHGNLINQVLADYQCMGDGGNGFLRIMTFRPAARRIDVRTYSPRLREYKTDQLNQFTLTY